MPKSNQPKAEWKGRKFGHPRYEFLNGIPARDLSDDEFDALSDEQRESLMASDLYKVRPEKEASEAKSSDSGKDTDSKTDQPAKSGGKGD